MSPFSLRNRSIMYSSAPACLRMLWNYACTLPDGAGPRQSCSFSVQRHHPSHPDAHCSTTVRLNKTWAVGQCCTQRNVQVQGIPGDMGCSPRLRGWGLEEVPPPQAAEAMFSLETGKGRRHGHPAQKQSSLFADVGLSTWTCGCRAQQ